MKDKLLTRGEKKAIKRKLNRKLFETFVLWLLNAAAQALGINAPQPSSANSMPAPNHSSALNDWKNSCKKMINKNKLRARERSRTIFA